MVLFERDGLIVADDRGIYVQANGREGSSVLLTMPDGRLLVTREYRAAVHASVWGLPGGMLNPGETAEACAVRELQEELGATGGALQRLGSVYPQPGVLDRLVHLFRAEVTALGASAPEADENITAVEITLAELNDRIRSGDPVDAELLCALYLAKLSA